MATSWPCDVPFERLQKRGMHIEPSHGLEWHNEYTDLIHRLQRLLYCPGGVFVLPGNTHIGLEIALRNLTKPNGHVLAIENGHWGRRLAEIAECCGFSVTRISFPEGKSACARKICAALNEFEYDTLTLVHGESSTGVLNDLSEVIKACKSRGTSLVLDAVATAGAVSTCEISKASCVLVFSVVKAIGSECGFVVLGLSQSASDRIRMRKHPVGYFSDINIWRSFIGNSSKLVPTIGSISVSQFRVLSAAVHAWEKEGSECRFARHMLASSVLRSGLRALGFQIIGDKNPLPTITAAYIPWKINSSRLVTALAVENVYIDTGIGDEFNRIIRIGHMAEGANTVLMEEFLKRLGIVMKNIF